MGTPRSALFRSSWTSFCVTLLVSGMVVLLGPADCGVAPRPACLRACGSCLHPTQPEPLCWMNCLRKCGHLDTASADSSEIVILGGDASAEKRGQENPDAYRIQHFRWGEPLPGKKRQPEESPEVPLGMDSDENAQVVNAAHEAWDDGWSIGEQESEVNGRPWSAAAAKKDPMSLNVQKENPELYQMNHFRWGQPPTHFKQKRYGGFMRKSSSYAHLKPLVTFFRDVMQNESPATMKN